MKALKSLPKPQNWQDFETLCKKLWGEIWECHEIKKNGRQGQVQNGVDVYGKPNGESGYYGIQCKGKDEYTGKNFTKKEIDKEIEKAKSFIPKLKKLYFATTAEKDARIEEYIREINLKNIENGIFEVEIYCWGDIVELIFENRNTYNYYVKSLNFKDNYSVELNFFNNSETLDLFPKFKKETIIKVGKTYKQYNPRKRTLDLLGASFNSRTEKVNVSLNQIRLKLRNSGERDIINFKIIIEIDGEITDIVENNMNLNIKKINSQSNIIINKEEKRIEIIPSKKILVGDDEYLPEEFYIKTPPYRTSLKLNWKLLSSNFKSDGVLLMNIAPEIIDKELQSETEYYHEIGTVIYKDIEDHWECRP